MDSEVSKLPDEFTAVSDPGGRVVNLRYCLTTAAMDCGETRHAQVVMRELGITYERAKPQSLGDQWWFWNCSNVPITLPKYLSELKLDLTHAEAVGYGLSAETARKLAPEATPEGA